MNSRVVLAATLPTSLRPTGEAAKPTAIGPEVVIDAVLRQVHQFLTLLPNLIMGAIFLAVVWGVAYVVKRIVGSAAHKASKSVPLVRALSRLSAIFIWVIGLFTAATIVVPSFDPGKMIAGLGIGSIAIGFAFKDVFQNFLAGVLLLWSAPFRIGDQIKSSGYEGTVEDIDIRATLLKTYDGERAILPNSQVYTNPLLVKTAFEKRRGRVEIAVDHSKPVEEVRKILEKAVRETPSVLKEPAPSITMNNLKESGMHFTVFLWSEKVGEAQDHVLMNIKKALDAAKISVVPEAA